MSIQGEKRSDENVIIFFQSLLLEKVWVFTKLQFSAGNFFSGKIATGSTENETETSNNRAQIPNNLNI